MNLQNKVMLTMGAIGLGIALSPISEAAEISQSVAPPPLEQPPTQLVPARTLATYPKGYFLESIVIDVDGTLYITENQTGQIIQRRADGGAKIFSQVEVGLADILHLSQELPRKERSKR